jgi:hypothetical protein
MSKILTAAVLGGIALAGTTPLANAAKSFAGVAAVGHPAATLPIIQADHRCGPGRHFVYRHRWHGRWIHSYCARNFHHPIPRN